MALNKSFPQKRKVGSVRDRIRPERFPLILGERGRVVLPARIRKQLGLKTGEKLIGDLAADGSIRISSVAEALESLRGILANGDGRVWSDELIKERRLEAARDEQRT